MAESQIDMTPECLVGWRVFRKSGNVTQDGVPVACDEIRQNCQYQNITSQCSMY